MLFAFILIPLLAAIAIFAGAPARKTALSAALLNILGAGYAASTWNCSCWNTGFQVLENPDIKLPWSHWNWLGHANSLCDCYLSRRLQRQVS